VCVCVCVCVSVGREVGKDGQTGLEKKRSLTVHVIHSPPELACLIGGLGFGGSKLGEQIEAMQLFLNQCGQTSIALFS
jgi:hypothetical protein